ncbi:MAG: hypothetical protein LBQ68_10450 [Clostridiales bacterium]|jgi:hypothetical protein|nr:hypothetical protein [Clostridiales bacterium]
MAYAKGRKHYRAVQRAAEAEEERQDIVNRKVNFLTIIQLISSLLALAAAVSYLIRLLIDDE